ncbi:MAG: hypothetical protein IT495_08590 [Gammaproteobacteria bacterium]|nr:hypothetical protein [Gammaproteobacteria bacterium]
MSSMYPLGSIAFEFGGLCRGRETAHGARVFSEQRGATRLVVAACATGATGGVTAERAIRAICASRFIPQLCREPLFWQQLLESVDTYLSVLADEAVCALTCAGIIDGQIVGACAGDISAFLYGPDGPRELTGAADPDAFLGSALAEPVGFGPVPFEGALLLGSASLFRGAAPARIRAAASQAHIDDAVAALGALVREEPGDLVVAMCRPQ